MTEEQSQQPAKRRRRRRRRSNPSQESGSSAAAEKSESGNDSAPSGNPPASNSRRRRRPHSGSAPGNGKQPHREKKEGEGEGDDTRGRRQGGRRRPQSEPRGGTVEEVSGILDLRKDGTGFLRQRDCDLAENASDPMIPQPLVRKSGLKNGSLIVGKGMKGRGHESARVTSIETVDGFTPDELRKQRGFKNLTVIDPDFHFELGGFEQENQLSMRILDLLCPIGRGQRGLLVAPPRTGKTTLMMAVANAMEALYPDVHLIVLLVDERPEEATYWRRSIKNGEVYVSTMDQSPKNHARLSELVQFRAERLVETGKEVMILLDSITRMTRAFNNTMGGGKDSRTMSGGLDARVFQRPKHFFGAARNTENGGSLTILATALVDTGSRMDQVIYEEFKGTGNMELTLDRRLADRRIYPAVSIEQTATRKEELLLSRTTLRKINILRRVLSRMRSREAVEMLIDRLARYPSNQEFLAAFSMDDVA